MSVTLPEDAAFMRRALQLAAEGLYSTTPNPRVGCVLVRDGQVVGEGFHHHAGGPHAERVALAAAAGAARGATAYVTLEPCCHHGRTPPCTDGLIEAGVARVVYADGDSNPRVAGGGVRQLEAAGIAVTGGVMANEARRLNRGFHHRHAHGRPFVTLKLGMSLDGKVALANGVSQWITGPAARADVQRWRAQSCAILTGIGTVLADDPRLTVRDERFDLGGRQPLRVIMDRQLRLSPQARVLQEAGRCVVFTRQVEGPAAAALRDAGAELATLAGVSAEDEILHVLSQLGAREINNLLVEAGPVLAGALVAAGVVDELVLYLAPMLLGGAAQSAFALPELKALHEASRWRIVETQPIGEDLRLVAEAALGLTLPGS